MLKFLFHINFADVEENYEKEEISLFDYLNLKQNKKFLQLSEKVFSVKHFSDDDKINTLESLKYSSH